MKLLEEWVDELLIPLSETAYATRRSQYESVVKLIRIEALEAITRVATRLIEASK